VATTAYDVITARLAAEAGMDVILVGDSVGNTLLGFDSTIPVTLDMMAHHTAAVTRARPDALVAADVPFGEAHFDYERVLAGCQRLMQQSGAEAVKMREAPGSRRLWRALRERASGLGAHRPGATASTRAWTLPQVWRRSRRGGTVAGRRPRLEKAGCFALLLEMTEPNLARTITETLKIPTIGIGSGPDCDGQILVSTDLLG